MSHKIKILFISCTSLFVFQNSSFAQIATNIAQNFAQTSSALSYSLPPSPGLGKAIFLNNCIPCHGTNGQGDGPMEQKNNFIPPPRDYAELSTFVNGTGLTNLQQSITNGQNASGVDTLDNSVMPHWGEPVGTPALTAAQIAAVASYISGAFIFPPNPGTCTFEGQISTNACSCPSNTPPQSPAIMSYNLAGSNHVTGAPPMCRPNNPYYSGSTTMTDYYQETTNNPRTSGYPVCGKGRIAVNASGSVLDISTSSVPYSHSVTNMTNPAAGATTYAYHYSWGHSNYPNYLYAPGFRCACAFTPINTGMTNPSLSTSALSSAASSGPDMSNAVVSNSFSTAPASAPLPATPVGPNRVPWLVPQYPHGTPISQVPSDLFGVISAPVPATKYSAVPIALDGQSDGRMGSVYGSSGVGGPGNANNSQCGCPNINEQEVPFDSTNTGVYCISMIGSGSGASFVQDKNAILVTYNPAIHSKQVINLASELINPTTQKIVTTIALPITLGGIQTKPYTRRIWTCAPGFTLSAGPPASCIADSAAKNACDDGTVSKVASAVSGNSIGTTLAEKFNNNINKKMACCMNAFTPGESNLKYDCIDNSTITSSITPTRAPYQSFDELWTSSDPIAAGGQLNAIVLANAKGQPITGFYKLNGERCSQYSEFGGDLTPYVNGIAGTPLPLPAGDGLVAYSFLLAKNLGGVPADAASAAACPILVRAAIIAICPDNPTSVSATSVQTTFYNESTFTKPAASASLPTIRCTAAAKIQIEVQVMQLTHIAGKVPLKTIDSVLDPKRATNISVSTLITRKNGGACPDGSVLMGKQCVHQ